MSDKKKPTVTVTISGPMTFHVGKIVVVVPKPKEKGK